jgi:hypothetical protein
MMQENDCYKSWVSMSPNLPDTYTKHNQAKYAKFSSGDNT